MRRELKAAFWALATDVLKLLMAFSAWWLIDWVVQRLFAEQTDGQNVFVHIAHWGSMATLLGPRLLTLLTELTALSFRLLRIAGAGLHGLWRSVTTGTVDD